MTAMLREGDLVYFLDEKGRRCFATLEGGMMRVEGLGAVDGSRVVGLQNGSRISLAGKSFWVLRPGVAELMASLERGAQVIGSKDAATIVHMLDLKCGDTVVEGGVGSGSLTTALLHAVGPNGRVISVELREEFARKALRNIERVGYDKAWDLRIGDVRTIEMPDRADAMVLDIPDPWEATKNAWRILKGGGRICSYVPNTNQVERAVRTLRDSGFLEVTALENIQRPIEVHEGGTRPAYEVLAHTGYMVFARKVIDEPQAKS